MNEGYGTKQPSKIAVIGGGWAGIAAATELAAQSSGMEIHLFEAGRHLGGRARQADIHGEILLDNGQHILLGAYSETLALMERLGASPTRLLRRFPLRVLDQTGFCLALPPIFYPLNLIYGLFSAKGVSFKEKTSCARFMAALKFAKFKLEKEESLSHWLTCNKQTGVLRKKLWEPLCLAAMNTPPEKASARIFAQVLRDSLGNKKPGATDILIPRASLSSLLPDPATEWLRNRGVRLSFQKRVRSLQQVEKGWKIVSGKDEVGQESFQQVILAVAPQHLKALLPDSMNKADFLPEYAFEPIATLYLHYPETLKLPYPLMALSGTDIEPWLIDRGDGLIAASFSGHGEWENLSRETLAEKLHRKIAVIFNNHAKYMQGISQNASHAKAEHSGFTSLPPYRFIKEKRATISCVAGQARCPQKTPWTGLFIAGDHCWQEYPATLEGAVRSGLAAARFCLEEASH